MKILNKIYSNIIMTLVLAIMLIIGAFMTSCEDEDKNNLNDFLATGGFVRFADQSPPTEVGVDDVSNLNYSFSVEDPNGSTESYELKLYADLSGTRTDTVQVSTVTSFPHSFSFTQEDLASLLGVSADNINFGDSFFFTATATTVDGLVYGGAENLNFDQVFPQPDGTYLDEDDFLVTVGPNDEIFTTADGNTFLVGGQNVSNTLLAEGGYRQAFEFNFIILCPPPASVTDLVGTWQITFDPFGTFVDDGVFEIIAGPGDNQVTAIDIFDHPNPDESGGIYYVIIDLDPATGAVTVERQAAWHCDNFGCPYGEGRIDGTGFLFNCVGNGLMKFNFEHTVDAGSFGTLPMDMVKL